jgi:hypothetical protein
MILEYLSGNCLNKYPFRDSNMMVSDTGYSLPNDFIADIQFFYQGTAAYTVFLDSFSLDVEDMQFNFTVKDLAGATLAANVPFSFTVAGRSEFETLVYSNTGCVLKLVLGTGLIQAIQDATEVVTQHWTTNRLELVTTATVQPAPTVTNITLYNNGSFFRVFSAEDVELELVEGANIDFNQKGNACDVTVAPGLGTGKFNPCGEDLVIKSINGITPNDIGNFLFLADDCYEVLKGYDSGMMSWLPDNGITLMNICAPKCTAAQMTNFAHYLNRVKDGMDTIAENAAATANELKLQIEDYITAAALTKNKPYFKVTYAKFPSYDPTKFYFSVVVGFFNPTTGDIAVNVSATGAVEDKTIRYKSGTVAESLTSATYTGIVPCVGVGRFEYVVYGEVGDTSTVSGTLNSIAFTDTITFS